LVVVVDDHVYRPILFVLIKVMVATVRCEEIGNEKVASFTADEVSTVHIMLRMCSMDDRPMHGLILNVFICEGMATN
jgi:hypothetical protein